MKTRIKQTLAFLFIFSSPLPAAAETPAEFFQQYADYIENFNPAVTRLYSDKALIHAYRVSPGLFEKHIEVSGRQWKQMLQRAMIFARPENDTSTFSVTEINPYEGGYLIKANRYSVKHCYTDRNYYMLIKTVPDGQFKIFEEYMEIKPDFKCQKNKSN